MPWHLAPLFSLRQLRVRDARSLIGTDHVQAQEVRRACRLFGSTDLHTSSEWYETTDFHSRPGLCETIHLLPEPSTVFEATQGVAVCLAQFWGKCEADIYRLPRNTYSAHIYKREGVSKFGSTETAKHKEIKRTQGRIKLFLHIFNLIRNIHYSIFLR